jgi:hypothetical protein
VTAGFIAHILGHCNQPAIPPPGTHGGRRFECRLPFVHHYAPAKAGLVWAGSDGGGRAALVVRPYEGRA